jgi:hypothetical protein
MKFCVLGLFFTLSLNSQADMIFTSDFEKGNDKSWRKQTCDSKAIMPVKQGQFGAPKPRAGKYMLRTRVWPEGRPKGCKPSNKIRTELVGNINIPPNNERWIGFSTYIPNSNGIRGNKPVAFFQLHYGALKGQNYRELFYLEVKQGKYYLLTTVDSPEKRRKVAISSVNYNTWTDWVIHLKFTQPSYKKEGYVQIWKNGKLVFDKKGHSLRNTTNISPKRKIGMYAHQGWPSKSINEMVMYHDEYRIGDQNASYKRVAAGGKSSKTVSTVNP